MHWVVDVKVRSQAEGRVLGRPGLGVDLGCLQHGVHSGYDNGCAQ